MTTLTAKQARDWFLRGYADWQNGKPNRFNENHPRDFEGSVDEWRDAQWEYNQGALAGAKDSCHKAA